MTGLPALRSLWFNLENVTAIAETAWLSVPHRPNWKVPSPPPPEITQQPLYLHLQRLCEWRQNWTAHLILKWDSFPAARTAQLDEGQRAATDNDESRRPGGGGGVSGSLDSHCFGSPAQSSMGVLFGQWNSRYLFSRTTSPLSNTTWPSKKVQSQQPPPLPRHYQPSQPAFLSWGRVWCLQVQEPPRRQRSVQRETHHDGGCRFGSCWRNCWRPVLGA